jgi:hypothetical protein
VSTTQRNIGIVLLLAVAVFALPSGGTGAGIVQSLLHIGFGVAIWLVLMRLYREHRTTIDGLGDRHRAILYASLAGILFVGASAGRFFDSGGLTVVWLALVGGIVYGLVTVFRHWRAYA